MAVPGELLVGVVLMSVSVHCSDGEPPMHLTALLIGPERVEVSWIPPIIPPVNGYRITVDNDTSSAVTVPQSQASITLVIAPGVHSIQVRSLSQHSPGRMLELHPVYVAGLYANTSSTSVNISWPYLHNAEVTHSVVLSRVTGPDQELCPDFEDHRSFTTAEMWLLLRDLQAFSDYTATVSSSLIPPISLTFTTLIEAPSLAPRNMGHIVTSRSVTVLWEGIDCLSLNGPFIGYEVNFVRVDGTETPVGEVSGETFVASGLEPGTLHTFEVAVLNRAGRGPFSSILRLRLHEEVPGTVSNFILSIMESSTAVLRWDPPQNPNGVIIAYEVAYNKNDLPPTRVNITNISDTTFSISQLDLGIIISNISVQAYTAVGPGAIVSLPGDHISNIETIVPNVRVTLIPGTTSVRVEWDRVNTTGLANYVVYYCSENGDEQSITVPHTQNYVVIEDLDDDKEFTFQVIGIGTLNTQKRMSVSDSDQTASVYIPCEDCLQTTALAVGFVFGFVGLLIITIVLVVRYRYIKAQDKKNDFLAKVASRHFNKEVIQATYASSSEELNMEPIEEPDLPEQDPDFLMVPPD